MPLPNQNGSLKFLAFGDFGTGDRPQYELAQQMVTLRGRFPFEMVVLLGDNLYGSERPQDFSKKFEEPYKPLLDAGVKFYAALGNHDAREQKNYPPFNMNDKLYYSFKAPKQSVRFYALESTYLEPEQVAWLEKELKGTTDEWKIVFFHHPLYSSSSTHGSSVELQKTLEPLFTRYNVSLVLNGHDHAYERIKPQEGIAYFVVGSAGQLRRGDLDKRSQITAKGFDTDQAFLALEINGDQLYFQAISRTGSIIDSGVITRRMETSRDASAFRPAPAPASAWPDPSRLQRPTAAAGRSAGR
jgi:predicted MPP superfamily phosphohydrolase